MTENDLDLDKLFLPAWAQQPAAKNQFAKYEGRDTQPRDDRRDQGGRRPAPRRDFGGGSSRPAGGDRGPRRDGGGRGKFGGDRGDQRGPRRELRAPAPPAPLPDLNVSFAADEKGVESLARQIKMNGRAYPLFQIARMILQKPERHLLTVSVKKNAEGAAIQPLFLCALDDSPWLSEEEATAYALKKHFATFYQAERTPTDPPKGVYTFVAQCGMSGAILGPPNYHDYQNKLRKLHAERFARMPFEAFKARVRIVKDEAVVKKWVEDQSFKTEYTCLNVPEPLKLASMAEVEKHFREVHKANIIKPVDSVRIAGGTVRELRSPELLRLLRGSWDSQFAFPLQIATDLSRAFATHGLQFFKVNKTVTHVSVARPQFLDLETTPVSSGIRGIVEYINQHPKCSRRKLIESLAPTPKREKGPAAPAAAIAAVASVAPAPAEAASTETPAQPVPQPAAPQPKLAATDEPTAEQTAIIADLHWLIHQGHVLEFADGRLETAKKPLPKPVKPVKPATSAAAPAAPETTTEATTESTPAGEAPSASDFAAEAAAEPPVEVPAPENSASAEPSTPAEPASEPPAPANT